MAWADSNEAQKRAQSQKHQFIWQCSQTGAQRRRIASEF